MLTMEREVKIADILQADKDRMAEILAMSPEDALVELNKNGDDFTLEEINDFAAKVNELAAKKNNGELDCNELENVSGGIGVIAVGAACVVGGFVVGVACNARW